MKGENVIIIEPIPSGNLPPGFDPSTCRSVYVGNIHSQVTEPLLQEVFASTGPVEDFKNYEMDRSFASVAEAEEVKSGQKVGRLQLFEITHRKKDGSPMTSEAGEIMEKLKEKKAEYEAIASTDSSVNLENIDNRIITEVLSPEKYSRVRFQGSGVTPTQYFGSDSQQYMPSGSQAQAEVQRLRDQIAQMQANTVEQIAEVPNMVVDQRLLGNFLQDVPSQVRAKRRENAFPPLTDEDLRFINNPVSDEEIRVALFDMAPLKASESDGFHALFYQSHWVKSIFAGKSIDAELNNSLIVLLPKIQNPECFAQFRPISLYSVLYKLVTKIIANHFKVVFPKLIAPEQTDFIAGRNITDNFVIAQEVVHSMKSKQKNRKWMAIKVDLEKAYDRVRWDFIDSSLQAAGIPIFLRNVIMSAISTSTMQVLWNGIPTSKFRPAKGVRQGCPLSPYLFILCMEWLSHNIHAAIGAGNWTPIRLALNGPPLSHLFFADDLILFGHAEEHQAQIIKNILDDFCNYSGHKINIRKTNIFFSKGVDSNSRKCISSFFGFQEVDNLGLYLGVPLFHERVTNNTLRFVVDKVRNKLSSWDARQLSLADRLTLAQSVLLSIPSYFMQTMMVPKGLCDEIE
ncbi:hypothetical protein PVK06_044807 [Gossypium arboreum]|uniref:Reverse transcriptase domain-containing protein n=1 Tax=Gossypium arboreum TaxID=29729 RepID=A0ABR0MSQ8_GOSAR|nr:hypothetical protein PVK06_044807 [Gossypium arboreum]